MNNYKKHFKSYKRDNTAYYAEVQDIPDYNIISLDTTTAGMLAMNVKPSELTFSGDLEDHTYSSYQEQYNALQNSINATKHYQDIYDRTHHVPDPVEEPIPVSVVPSIES